MTFIQRNRRELIWLALNVAAVGFNLWFALWSSLWPMHALFFVTHVVISGYCAKLIFDNARLYAVMAALEDRIADIEAVRYEMTAYGRRADGTLGPLSHQEYADLTAADDLYLAGEVRRVLNDEVSQ